MKIAILGAGMVGGTLGKRFAEAGHEIFFGVPNPSEYEDKNLAGKIGTVAEAAASAPVILLAVPFDATADALENCGDLTGKIVIDATNPLATSEAGLNLTVGYESSGAERVAELAGGAKVVKCFNQTGFNNMEKPDGSMMFVCGDDERANETARRLAEEIGFDAIAIGDLSKARLLEPLAMLWIHLAFNSDLKRDFAFAIKRK